MLANNNHPSAKPLGFSMLLVLLCQGWFVFSVLFRKVYYSDFPDHFLQEMLQLPPRTPQEMTILSIHAFGALLLTVGCYVITIYICLHKRFRPMAQKYQIGIIMLVAFLVSLFLSFKVRSAYTSIALAFLGTEVYSLVLLCYILLIRKKAGAGQ